MESVDLKEHLEVFAKLPGHEYSLLEKACKEGLALTPYAINGKGREIIKEDKELFEFLKNLNEAFPTFEKTTISKNKLKNLLALNERRGYSSYLDMDGLAGKLGWADVFGGIVSLAAGAIYDTAVNGGATAIVGLAWVVPSFFYALSNLAIIGIGTRSTKCFTPSALAVCSAQYLKDRQLKKRRLQRSVRRGEEKLVKEIIEKRYGLEGYGQEWYKKIEKDLLGELFSCDENFPAKFIEMQKRLVPEDELRLHKTIEESVQRKIENTDYTQNFGRVQELYGIAELARNAGVGAEPGLIRQKIEESIPEIKKRKQKRIAQIQERAAKTLKRAREDIIKERELEKEEVRKRKLFLKKI